MKTIKCPNCSTTFETKRNTIHCSNKCRDERIVKRRLRIGSIVNRALRKWLYQNLEQKCYMCGIGCAWNEKPLRLQIDHINGNIKDNRLVNLKMICPNCHTQTETWGVKNSSDEGRKRMVDGANYLRKLRLQKLHR